jgi:hypothetical protein
MCFIVATTWHNTHVRQMVHRSRRALHGISGINICVKYFMSTSLIVYSHAIPFLDGISALNCRFPFHNQTTPLTYPMWPTEIPITSMIPRMSPAQKYRPCILSVFVLTSIRRWMFRTVFLRSVHQLYAR